MYSIKREKAADGFTLEIHFLLQNGRLRHSTSMVPNIQNMSREKPEIGILSPSFSCSIFETTFLLLFLCE